MGDIRVFLNTARGRLFLFYDYRMRKVAQGVFFVLHSGAKYQHLTKMCWGIISFVCARYMKKELFGIRDFRESDKFRYVSYTLNVLSIL